VDDSGWYAEIEGRRRRRFRGVYLLLAFAALMAVGFANTQRIMHDGDLQPASAPMVESLRANPVDRNIGGAVQGDGGGLEHGGRPER
jgi:hypothetical protein